MTAKPKLIWILQTNQVTSIILNYLRMMQTRLVNLLDLSFMIPSTSTEIKQSAEDLSPEIFNVSFRGLGKSYEAYLAKKNQLDGGIFPEGLPFSETLLLDDLGGGNIHQAIIDLPELKKAAGIILQIPTPLGSTDAEERIFHAIVLLAKQQGVPVIGYELLPLDTRWSLAPAMVDGVIATRRESAIHLQTNAGLSKNIWLLTRYESRIFSPAATQFALNGVKAAFYYNQIFKLPQTRTILYIPHNVAMIHEYKKLLLSIQELGQHLHLMFTYGTDQVRGAYTHQDIIETVCTNELKQFASHSFHDLNKPWEMLMADGVIACSTCFSTVFSEANNLPTYIFDTDMPSFQEGYKHKINEPEKLVSAVKTLIARHEDQKEFSDILYTIATRGKQ